MKLGVYSVYDSKAKGYLQPFHAVNAAVATRMIMDAVGQPDHMFNKHAADYTLLEIAEFDDETGIFTPLSTATNLGTLLAYLPTTGGSNV